MKKIMMLSEEMEQRMLWKGEGASFGGLDDVEFLLELLGLELEPSAIASGVSEGTAKGTEHGAGQLGRELNETDKEAEEGRHHDGDEGEEHEHGVEAELVELVVGVEEEVATVKVEHVLVVLGHKSH